MKVTLSCNFIRSGLCEICLCIDGLPHVLTMPGIWLTPRASSSVMYPFDPRVQRCISIYSFIFRFYVRIYCIFSVCLGWLCGQRLEVILLPPCARCFSPGVNDKKPRSLNLHLPQTDKTPTS
ncbi:hypothetical protein V8C26DRAFT_400676 [Trichoderma gracile]